VKHNLDDISRSEIVKAIDEWILNERDREMLKRRLVDGITYEALSYEFDLSVRHTKTIIYKAEDRLFTKIAHN
jgi:DNA-directed RNA polymerase specialized sigma24 family protein